MSSTEPNSRLEILLQALLNGEIPDIRPQSRAEVYLLALCDKSINGGSATPGSDGGYYTPTFTQVDNNTVKVSFTASKDGMPAIEDEIITLPAGEDGNDGHTPQKGTDYFTESDKQEIIDAIFAQVIDGSEVSY